MLLSFLDEVKLQISEATVTKPKDNLNKGERKALKTLKSNNEINIKKAVKGTMTVIMNKSDKIQEGQVQLEDTDYYQPLDQPMVVETANKVAALIQELYDGKFIDDKTLEWLLQTPNPPHIPEFYTLTKIHKPTIVGRPIISGCDSISAFVVKLLQPIAQSQKS